MSHDQFLSSQYHQQIQINSQHIYFINYRIYMNKLLLSSRYFAGGKKTMLYDFHVENKGKIVDFAGYLLPVQYQAGILKQSIHCRQKASLFDVSHMGQFQIAGVDRLKLLERTTVGSTIRKQKNGISQAYLTLFLNQNAGIIDDAIVSINQENDVVRVIANAGNKYTILNHFIQISRNQYFDVKIDLAEQLGLLALQGPMAVEVLQSLVSDFDLSQVPFMSSFKVTIKGEVYLVSRSGYTGQDGFQISGNQSQISALTELLMKDERVAVAGLGARDTLRVQAGLCLHGHEMNSSITPFEAGLMWTVHKRKTDDPRIPFIGQDRLKHQVADNKAFIKNDRKRVGFIIDQSGIVRDGCRLYNENDQEIGITTSGIFSPALKKCIGMAYVDREYLKTGTVVFAEQRNKKLRTVISKMPFIPSRYYKGWNQF